jgi:hypothetical protein
MPFYPNRLRIWRLSPAERDDAGFSEFAQGFRCGFAVNMQVFRDFLVRQVLNAVSFRPLEQQPCSPRDKRDGIRSLPSL